MPKTLHKRHAGASPPTARYAPALEVDEGRRWLYLSGQVGTLPDGSVAQGAEDQMHAVFTNIQSLLRSAGMGWEHLVRFNVYLTRREDLQLFRDVRDSFIGDAEPASTLLIVAGLASPDFLVEIEAVAAA